MYCRNCGKEIYPNAAVCPSCGVPPRQGYRYCQSCGYTTEVTDQICMHCGVRLARPGKDWLITLLLNLFAGVLGAHRFYTGHIAIGVIQLLTLGGCGIWTLIDLILILVGSYRDADGNELEKKNY